MGAGSKIVPLSDLHMTPDQEKELLVTADVHAEKFPDEGNHSLQYLFAKAQDRGQPMPAIYRGKEVTVTRLDLSEAGVPYAAIFDSNKPDSDSDYSEVPQSDLKMTKSRVEDLPTGESRRRLGWKPSHDMPCRREGSHPLIN